MSAGSERQNGADAQIAEDEGQIRVSREGAVLLLGIDRVAKRNAVTPAMLTALAEGLTLLETDPDLRCAVIHAIGPHFSSGMDFRQTTAGPRPMPPGDLVDPFALRLPCGSKPVVLALKGYSYTVAVSLLLAADIVVAAEDSKLAFTEARYGMMPTLGGVPRLIERLGWGNAMSCLLTGREMDAAEALRLGLVQEIVAPGRDTDRALEIAGDIARMAPLAVAAIKQNGRTFQRRGFEAAMAEIPLLREQLMTSDDAKEAREARAEKRPPVFRGR